MQPSLSKCPGDDCKAARLLLHSTRRLLNPKLLHLGQAPLAHTGIAVIRGQCILASGFRKIAVVCNQRLKRDARIPKAEKTCTRYSMEPELAV